MSWLKVLLIGGFAMIITSASIFLYLNHEGNIRAAQEINIGLKSANLGEIREGKNATLSKKDFVANLVVDVIKTQKNHGKDLRIDYVFLDSNDKQTEVESNISSAQFQITILNDKGEAETSAVTKLSLKEDKNG